MAVGQEAVIANTLKAAGQGVLEEETDELLGGHGHHLAKGVAVVGPGEGDLAVLKGQDALVADGDAVGVATEVFQHAGRSAKGGLSVNHPFLIFQGSQEAGKGARVAQGLELSEKLQGAIGVSLLQSLQHQLAEAGGEDFDGQEKLRFGGDPALMVRGETAAGNDAVEVGVEVEVLTPAMEDAEETEFHSQTFRRDVEQGFGRGVEKDSVDDFFVVESQGGDLLTRGGEARSILSRIRSAFVLRPWSAA
jgi:hypothetical protein